jgi:signal transduction histidine kinase/DNA-binding response OmpR family regulator/HPt (histidine-containing phosphotransfer) domain-containing protein
MKEADPKTRLLKRDSLLVTAAVFFFCIIQGVFIFTSGVEFLDKFIWAFFAGITVLFLALIYIIPVLWLYSFLTSIVLFIFYLLLALSSKGAAYFFVVCVCITWICCFCHEPLSAVLYGIVSNAITGLHIIAGAPLMGAGVSRTVTCISWFASIAASLFLFYITYGISHNKRHSQESLYYFKTLLTSTPNCVALLDELRRTLFISDAMANIFHIPYHELMIGRPITDLINNKELRSRLGVILHNDVPYEGILEIVVNQQTRYYQIIYLKFDNNLRGSFLCLNEVTAVMVSKIEAEQSARTKGIFLANTSHEIRTPMNAILGMVELILRKDVSPDVYEDAMTIKQSGENLLAIINDILDFSKIESGKFEITPTNYMFASLIHDVINIIRVKLVDKPILFIVNIDNRLPKDLLGDISRVRQVLLNLLSNAIKFTTEGYISLFVSGERLKDNRILLYFDVNDTGIGMQEGELSKLFDNFVQLTSRPNVEGTGLGLAISRNLCRLMGGDITVQSEFGRGSGFTASMIQNITNNEDFAVVGNPTTKTVLVYDDRRMYAESISRSICDLGAKCDIALNEDEFLSALKKKSYKFIFISNALFQSRRVILRQYGQNATIGLLTEQNEISASPDIVTITTPAYAISIANVLNGDNEEAGFFTKNATPRMRFSAPSARVLIVDDVPTNLKVATGLMLPYKLKIATALSGIDALKLINENEYDLVFMDHMMPIMDGIETLHKIREKGGNYRNLPVVALTANAVIGMREMFLEEGFNDYISKPIDTSKLDEVLFKWIPKDKHQKPLAFDMQKAKNMKQITIEDVDVAEGMKMANGSMESYLEILSIYIKDSKERYNMLCSFLQTIETIEPDPHVLTLFTTQVHALKSASASIGAKKLSEEALKLEMAGKAAAIEFIRQNLGLFCSNLAVVIERIEAVLPRLEKTGEDIPLSDEDKRNLLSLKEAFENEDIRKIDVLFDGLSKKAFGSSITASLNAIGDHILVSEFGEALTVLEELIR